MNNQLQIEEVLYQLHQGNLKFAEKLIGVFQLNCFEKKFWGFLYKKDENEIKFWFDGTKEWYKNGDRHRAGDKPAVIHADGTKEWFKNDCLHRDDDKPAIVHADGTKEWWVNGEFIIEEK